MALTPGILARGPWALDQVEGHWREPPYEPAERRDRRPRTRRSARCASAGSPAHDGLSGAARRRSRAARERLVLELEPIRWALRLDRTDAAQSVAAMCVVRAHDGRWLAGRRADWLATWAGRWALGAGGRGRGRREPGRTRSRASCARSGRSSPSGSPSRRSSACRNQLVLLVGLAWLADGRRRSSPTHEHDELRVVAGRASSSWPAEADEPLRQRDAPTRSLARRSHRDHVRAARARLVLPLGGLHGAADLRLRLPQPAAGDVHPRALARPAVDRHVAGLPAAPCALRMLPLRIAVAVAVLGGIGPFFGSAEFVREQRRRAAPRPERARVALDARARVR